MKAYSKKAKITVVSASLFLLPFSCAYGETVVHTTRYHYDANVADNAPVIENFSKKESVSKQKSNFAANSGKKQKRRLPAPYSFEQAIDYAEMQPDDITIHKIYGMKDKYGNFSKWVYFDFLGDQGLYNRGDSFWGFADHTYLRLTMHIGQETNKIKPFVILSWHADVNRLYKKSPMKEDFKDPILDNKYKPTAIRIVFESGYEKSFPIEPRQIYGYNYLHFGLFLIEIGLNRGSYIVLSNEDIWEIYRHGNIANVCLDDGYGTGNVSFFYSGEKQEEHKRQLTYGFQHIARLLNVNKNTIIAEREKREALERKEYRENVRAELKERVRKELVEKDLLKEVREEVQEEIKLDKENGQF